MSFLNVNNFLKKKLEKIFKKKVKISTNKKIYFHRIFTRRFDLFFEENFQFFSKIKSTSFPWLFQIWKFFCRNYSFSEILSKVIYCFQHTFKTCTQNIIKSLLLSLYSKYWLNICVWVTIITSVQRIVCV